MLQNANVELEQFEMCIMQHRLAQPNVSSRRGKLAPSLFLPPCNFAIHSCFSLHEETNTLQAALPGTLSVLGLGGAKGIWLSELGGQSAAQPGACQHRAEVLGRKPQPCDFVLSVLSFLFQLASAGRGGEAQLMFSSLRSVMTSSGAEMFGERAFSLSLVLLSGQHWMFGNPESIKHGENPRVHPKALVWGASLPTCHLLQLECCWKSDLGSYRAVSRGCVQPHPQQLMQSPSNLSLRFLLSAVKAYGASPGLHSCMQKPIRTFPKQRCLLFLAGAAPVPHFVGKAPSCKDAPKAPRDLLSFRQAFLYC